MAAILQNKGENNNLQNNTVKSGAGENETNDDNNTGGDEIEVYVTPENGDFTTVDWTGGKTIVYGCVYE